MCQGGRGHGQSPRLCREHPGELQAARLGRTKGKKAQLHAEAGRVIYGEAVRWALPLEISTAPSRPECAAARRQRTLRMEANARSRVHQGTLPARA
eukprot:12872853-Alexandrium_andersonii.AAC.1